MTAPTMSSNTSFSPDLSQTENDHSAYWFDNPYKVEKTKNYCDQARLLVDGGIIRTGVQHPWMDNMIYDASRVRVVDFSYKTPGEQGHAGSYFSDARCLNDYFSASARESDQKKRTLIIIEGLEPRMLEVVGVRFVIPPSFFLGHCDEWTDINVVDRACAKPSNPVYWRIPVPQERHISTEALENEFGKDCYGRWDIITGNTERWSFEMRSDVERIHFHNLVSYWGMRSSYNEQGSSWIAIVLVDPRPTTIRKQPTCTNESQEVQLFHLENFDVPHKLFSEAIVSNEFSSFEQESGSGIPAWLVPSTHRNHRQALFDEVTDCFQECGLPPQTNDPMSSTVYIRNFVRSAWEEAVWRWGSDLHDWFLENNRNIEDQRKRGLLTGQHTVEVYHDGMRRTSDIKDSRQHVRRIMRAFRFSDDAYPKRDSDNLASPATLECRSWTIILEKLEMMEQSLCDHLEMFSRRATLLQVVEAEKQTAQAMRQSNEASIQTSEANRMARSSGQLTKIATVIVPCSFVASIFSMGDEFAVGKPLFYIYWVISMPVTFILLVWVIYGDKVQGAWADALRETKRQYAERAPRGSKWSVLRPFLSNFMSNLRSPVEEDVGQKARCTEV